MARKSHNPAAEALEDIEHLGDRIVESVSNNPVPLLAVLGAILLGAAGYGGWTQWQAHQHREATRALEAVRSDYLEAMGAGSGYLEVPEPANPETARQIREEHAERFEAVGREQAGTRVAALAELEAGDLWLELGRTDAALAAWERGLEEASDRPGLQGLLLERVAQAHEEAGRWAEAAAAYERAGEIGDYPLRYAALAQAGRCYAEAGQPDQAVALYKRIRAEAPEARLPEHIAARLRELAAAP